MSKKTIYVDGVRFFPKGENAHENVLANGVITPNKLIECLKRDDVQDAKSEYQGDVQFKFTLWKNDDGSVSMSFNTYKPNTEKEQIITRSTPSNDGGDLPF